MDQYDRMNSENALMQIYLLRHGIAEEGRVGKSDAERALTQEGRRKLRQVLHTAAEADVKPSLVLSSPFRRALETAEIARDVLGYKGQILQTDALTPASTVEQAWSEIRDHAEEASLLLVGHNPLFDQLGAFLLGSPRVDITFKKGALLRVDVDRVGAHPKGTLRWYLTPKLTGNHR